MTAALPAQASRVAFLGTPEVAVPPLRAIHDAGIEIPLVVTRPDARRGRRGKPTPSPVKSTALALGLAVSESADDVLDVAPDLAVVVAFGEIIRPPLLDEVPLVNLHFSLLPRWRGAAPVERAILAGDRQTGVALMGIEAELDTGDIYDEVTVDIGDEETLHELRSRLVEVGTERLVTALRDGFAPSRPQQGEPTYAAKIDADVLHLDWSQPAEVVHRVIRLERSWTTFRDRRFRIGRARLPAEQPERSLGPGELLGTCVGTGTQALELVEVQPEGKAMQTARAWANGARLGPGDRFTR